MAKPFVEGVSLTAERKNRDPVVDALRDLLIVQLAVAGVDTRAIRKAAGVDMNRVSRFSKMIQRAKKKGAK